MLNIHCSPTHFIFIANLANERLLVTMVLRASFGMLSPFTIFLANKYIFKTSRQVHISRLLGQGQGHSSKKRVCVACLCVVFFDWKRILLLISSLRTTSKERPSVWGLTSHSTHNRSLWRRVFPGNQLHWYWQPKTMKHNTTYTVSTKKKQKKLP